MRLRSISGAVAVRLRSISGAVAVRLRLTCGAVCGAVRSNCGAVSGRRRETAGDQVLREPTCSDFSHDIIFPVLFCLYRNNHRIITISNAPNLW